ncbi:MAG TPA: phosphatase PAP2 family protein [Gaiellaceae bacterium]
MTRFSGRREVALGLGVYALYLGVRALVWTEDGRRRADRNAARIVEAERRLQLHVEPQLQRLLLPRRRLLTVLNIAYVTLNVGLTVGWLMRLYHRREPGFFRYRRAVALATAGAQPVYLLFPVAPPRKLDHLTDTIAEAGLDLDSGLISKLYCPIGAMPSIHVAYAVVVGEAIRKTGPRWLRRLAPAYAPAVAVTVFATANHYFLDGIAGAALGGAALRLSRRLGA